MSNRKCPRAPKRGHRTPADELNCPYCSLRKPTASAASGIPALPKKAARVTLVGDKKILFEGLALNTSKELSEVLEKAALDADLEESEATAVIRDSTITLGGGHSQDGPVSYKRLKFENCKIRLLPPAPDPFDGTAPGESEFESRRWGHVGGTDFANISYDMTGCHISSAGEPLRQVTFLGGSSAEDCTLSPEIEHIAFPRGQVVDCNFGGAITDVSSGAGDLGDQFVGAAPRGVIQNSRARAVVADIDSKIRSSKFEWAEVWGVSEPNVEGSIYLPDGAVLMHEVGSTTQRMDGTIDDHTISHERTEKGERIVLADGSKSMSIARDPDKTAVFPLFALNQKFVVDHQHLGIAARNLFIDSGDGYGRLATNNDAALEWLHEAKAIHSDGTVDRHLIPVARKMLEDPA